MMLIEKMLLYLYQDFAFILKGLTRLLNNPLLQTYLPGSCKRIQFHQELLIFFWKICDINKVCLSSVAWNYGAVCRHPTASVSKGKGEVLPYSLLSCRCGQGGAVVWLSLIHI